MVAIAKVLKSNGADGELVLGLLDIAAEDMDSKEPVFISFDGLPVPFFFESFVPRGSSKALVRLTGVHNLKDAEELVGFLVYAEDGLYEEEEEGLLGWTVLSADGQRVGEICDLEAIPGNPCVYVATPMGEALLPLREELILEMDEQQRCLRMMIPEGLLDL